MKLIKLLAVSLLLIFWSPVFAVVLPSTSYGGGSGSSSSYNDGEVVFSTGVVTHGSYVSLGAGSKEACEGDGNGYTKDGLSTCSKCCQEQFPDDEDKLGECVIFCWSGQSPIPLDGGFSILLALAIGSGAVRAFNRRK